MARFSVVNPQTSLIPPPHPHPPPPAPDPALPPPPAPLLPPPLRTEGRPSKVNSSSLQTRRYSKEDYRSMLEREIARHNLVNTFRYFLPDFVVDGLIQRGPCCGIVALHLALVQLKSLRPSSFETVASVTEIMEMARSKDFTSIGEMFSCKNMATLARCYLPSTAEVTLRSFSGQNVRACGITFEEHFSAGGLVLAPYDKDVDFRPCSKRGSSAHWALLLGMVWVSSGEAEEEDERGMFEGNKLGFVAAKHGKSLRLAFWNLDDLFRSNAQLKDYDLDKLRHENSFGDDFVKPIIPNGGLEEGLANKMIFIRI